MDSVIRGISIYLVLLVATRLSGRRTMAQMTPFDFVLSPVAPVPSYAAELASPIHDPDRPFEHIVFTLPANMSDQPSIAVPAAMTAGGLPIGLQITGRRFDDLGVLRMAAAYETLCPELTRLPPMIAG